MGGETRALVTGGTSGVGASIVRGLVAAGARVDVIGTNPERGQRMAELVRPGGGRFFAVDLGDLGAVQSFVEPYAAEDAPLDVLVCAAGVLLPTRQVTPEGFERTFAIGYVSAFVLANRLRARLAAARRARVVLVSGTPKPLLRPRLDFDDLTLQTQFSLRRAALNGVHAKTVLAHELSERFAADGIDVNAVHPGGVKSDLLRNLTFPLSLAAPLVQAFMQDESEAGIRAATAAELAGTTGQMLEGTTARPLPFDPGYRDRLWQETVRRLPADLRPE